MTAISNDLLAAFADGELDDETAAAVRSAVDADPGLAAQLDAHRQLRRRVGAAYRGVLDEPVPDRLLQALHADRSSVVDLAAQRAARAESPRVAQAAARRLPSWAQWGGIAASLLIGVVVGHVMESGRSTTEFETTASGLVASGAVADALSNRLASDAAGDQPIRLQISFVDQAGRYCRTFTTPVLAGLACRDGGEWSVQTLLRQPAPAQPVMRQAASPLPEELLRIVDSKIRGTALDAAAEQAARQRNWRR